MGETPVMYARDDYFNFIKKANDEVLNAYDYIKRPRSASELCTKDNKTFSPKFSRNSKFEIGRGRGKVEKWVQNNKSMKPG